MIGNPPPVKILFLSTLLHTRDKTDRTTRNNNPGHVAGDLRLWATPPAPCWTSPAESFRVRVVHGYPAHVCTVRARARGKRRSGRRGCSPTVVASVVRPETDVEQRVLARSRLGCKTAQFLCRRTFLRFRGRVCVCSRRPTAGRVLLHADTKHPRGSVTFSAAEKKQLCRYALLYVRGESNQCVFSRNYNRCTRTMYKHQKR